MKTTSVKNKVHSLPQAGPVLAQKIKKYAAANVKEFKRFDIEIEPVDLLQWLYGQKAETKIYYKSRDGKFQIAAVEAADRIVKTETCQISKIYQQARAGLDENQSDLHYLGGICFDPSNKGQEWQDFGTAQFVLPLIEIMQNDERTVLAANIVNAASVKLALKILSDINNLKQIPLLSTTNKKREDSPSKLQWCAAIENVLEKIRNKEIEKAVMARRVELTLKEKVDPLSIVRQLERTIERCSLFLFQFNKKSAFIGASPELLFKRDGREMQTEAIAGTRSRGTSDADDALLSKDLMASTKDKNEQHFVVAMIDKKMRQLCDDVQGDDSPQILLTNNGIHLATRFKGEVSPQINDGKIMEALHPTPAVGGTPTAEAVRIIQENEGFSRGWYAGAVGYFGLERSEFSVAIRCALVQDNGLKLFSGAGIVAGSYPLAEWEETEYKLGTFLDIFKK